MTSQRDDDSSNGRIERAKDSALGAHDSHPSHADELGEAAGAITGVLAGAGIGSAAGPIGTLIGGIAGALGGWWTGRAVAEAASSLTHEDDDHFRAHYLAQPNRHADRAFDDVRSAYYLGQIAAHNPNFKARQFEDVEAELEEGWGTTDEKSGTWVAVRTYAEEGYARGKSKLDETARRARAEHQGRTLRERPEERP